METLEQVQAERDALVKHLAEWCWAIERNGSGWDDWDDYYKAVAYGDRGTFSPALGLRLAKAIKQAKIDIPARY